MVAVVGGGTGFRVERLEMAAEAACFSASEEDPEGEAASLASISEGSRGSCFGSRSGGCEVVEDDIGAVCNVVQLEWDRECSLLMSIYDREGL